MREVILKSLYQYFEAYDEDSLYNEEFMFFNEEHKLVTIQIHSDGTLDYSTYEDFDALNTSENIDWWTVEMQSSPHATALYFLDNI